MWCKAGTNIGGDLFFVTRYSTMRVDVVFGPDSRFLLDWKYVTLQLPDLTRSCIADV